MSINSKLVTFAQQELVLAHNDNERKKISASLDQLESVIEREFRDEIDEIIRFGSYTRNTILPRRYDSRSDVDLLVVFETEENGLKSPGTYRKYLKDLFEKAYPNSLSEKDFPAVKLELNYIIFDVVPAYTDSMIWKTYHIPDKNDKWRDTEPNDINDRLTSKNQDHGNNIVRNVIRLCKHWNANVGYVYESYVMEKKILEVFFWGNDTYSSFTSVMNSIAGSIPGVRQALEYLEKYKDRGDEAKQFEWLQKLLPGLK